jgi:hypothetical protein
MLATAPDPEPAERFGRMDAGGKETSEGTVIDGPAK